jgi:hypothetical protein
LATRASLADLTLVHRPVRASWLNQAEIFCSIVQLKVLRPNCFENLAQLARTRTSSSTTTTRVPSPSTGRSHAPTSPSYSKSLADREPPTPRKERRTPAATP